MERFNTISQSLGAWAQGIDLSRIIEWLMFALAALISISVHESCHALSAYWLGDDTAKRRGRISLNPLRHLELFGFVMMVVAHFGWAKPVPVDPYRMTKIKKPKVGMALTAAAGPISNLLLALFFCLCYFISVEAGDRRLWMMLDHQIKGSGWHYYLSLFFLSCLSLNASLAVFNLLPISPLDGSKILGLVLPEKAYATLMRYERYGMFLLIALLYLRVLEKPLGFLVGGVIDGIAAITGPLAAWIVGA